MHRTSFSLERLPAATSSDSDQPTSSLPFSLRECPPTARSCPNGRKGSLHFTCFPIFHCIVCLLEMLSRFAASNESVCSLDWKCCCVPYPFHAKYQFILSSSADAAIGMSACRHLRPHLAYVVLLHFALQLRRFCASSR